MILDPLAYISRYESDNLPFVGYGGSDLSKAPLSPTGFPQWAGVRGPKGISHAAGLYQLEPATWDAYAIKLSIHDFSIASQMAVARALYDDLGFSSWAPYNPRLAAAIIAAKGKFV